MTAGVVDRLEAVQIHHHEGQIERCRSERAFLDVTSALLDAIRLVVAQPLLAFVGAASEQIGPDAEDSEHENGGFVGRVVLVESPRDRGRECQEDEEAFQDPSEQRDESTPFLGSFHRLVWHRVAAEYREKAFSRRRLGGAEVFCDGDVNAFDIEPFLLALFDPATYAIQFPDCDINNADINGDGIINAFDIEPFLELLFGP